MHGVAGRHCVVRRLDTEKSGSSAAQLALFFRCIADRLYFHLDANGDAGQRVIAIQHHVLRVDVGDRVERIFGGCGIAASGQCPAFYALTFFELGGE